MAESDDEDNPLKGRMRSPAFETHNFDYFMPTESRLNRPTPIKRGFTSPDVSIIRRPQLSQISSTSEEIIQKTKSGFLDLTEKGRATFQQAGNSVTEFRDRLLNQTRSVSDTGYSSSLQSPTIRESDKDYIGVSDDEYPESSEEEEEEEPRSRGSSTPSSQRDRKEVSDQNVEDYASLKC